MGKFFQSTNLTVFKMIKIGSIKNRGALISLAGTGLWKNYFFIYLNGQLKAELMVSQMFRPKPEPDAFFYI